MKKGIAVLLLFLLIGALSSCVGKKCSHKKLHCPACHHEFTPPDED